MYAIKKPPGGGKKEVKRMNYDFKKLAKNLIDTYNATKPIYSNTTAIYGNSTPVVPPINELCELLKHLHTINPKISEKLNNIGNVLAAKECLDMVSDMQDFIPVEYQDIYQTFVQLIKAIFWFYEAQHG